MTQQNLTFNLIEKISADETKDRCPHLFAKFRKMPGVLEESQKNDDRLREVVRKMLPADLSRELVPTAERMVTEAGEALRRNLFALFAGEIDAALELDRKPSAKLQVMK